jgi:hypothetical protein
MVRESLEARGPRSREVILLTTNRLLGIRQSRAGLKPRLHITGLKPRLHITGLKPRLHITGLKPRIHITALKPRLHIKRQNGRTNCRQLDVSGPHHRIE